MSGDKTIKKPIINCHTHIFTGDQVPPYLAKDYVPFPFYYLFPVPMFISLFKHYRSLKDRIRYSSLNKKIRRKLHFIRSFVRRKWLLRLLVFLLGVFLSINAFYVLFDWIASFSEPSTPIRNAADEIKNHLIGWKIFWNPNHWLLKFFLVIVVLLFIKSGRNLIIFLCRQIWSWMKVIPGKLSFQLMGRYLLLARYALHKSQKTIFSKLKGQYPANTGFVVLPMDMKYMDAGKIKCKQEHDGDRNCKDPYYCQLDHLTELLQKDKESQVRTLFPFLFVDPRRMEEDPDFFQFEFIDGKVILKDCKIKKYIEEEGFSGFKIYPALGYYVFDQRLLPLWLYAVQENLPIMTHCIKGTIYYRGSKKKEWDEHPIFEQVIARDKYVPLILPEKKGCDFSINFTHPMNYLCLLNEYYLRIWLDKLDDPTMNELFGYKDLETPLDRNMDALKICFGHFGGEDQWLNFLERERYHHSNQVITNPDFGIDFVYKKTTGSQEVVSPGKPEQLWKSTDWYSIIISLMLQHPNVYSDISYIIHDKNIFPLLHYTLEHPRLQTRVLFGTDYYVVRNHKSEKSIYVDSRAQMGIEAFDRIARENPYEFLNLD